MSVVPWSGRMYFCAIERACLLDQFGERFAGGLDQRRDPASRRAASTCSRGNLLSMGRICFASFTTASTRSGGVRHDLVLKLVASDREKIREELLESRFAEFAAKVRELEKIVEIRDRLPDRVERGELQLGGLKMLLNFFEVLEAFFEVFVELRLRRFARSSRGACRLAARGT